MLLRDYTHVAGAHFFNYGDIRGRIGPGLECVYVGSGSPGRCKCLGSFDDFYSSCGQADGKAVGRVPVINRTLLFHIRHNLQQHIRRNVSGPVSKQLPLRFDEPGGWQIVDLVHAGYLFFLVYINLYRSIVVVYFCDNPGVLPGVFFHLRATGAGLGIKIDHQDLGRNKQLPIKTLPRNRQKDLPV